MLPLRRPIIFSGQRPPGRCAASKPQPGQRALQPWEDLKGGMCSTSGCWHMLGLLLLLALQAGVAEAGMLLKQVLIVSGINRCVEIQNVRHGNTTFPASLLDYGLFVASPRSNSSWTPLVAPLCNPCPDLAVGGTFLVCHPQATSLLVNLSSVLSESLSFNGANVLGLARGSTVGGWQLVDVYGDISNPPPLGGWSVGGMPNVTWLHTVVRKVTVLEPSTDWASSAGTNASDSQWEVFPVDTFSLLGAMVDVPQATWAASQLCSAPVGAGVQRGDRRQDLASVMIGTYTINWLSDGINDVTGSPWDGGSSCPGTGACTPAGAAARLQAAAQSVLALGVDILNVVEVKSCGVLGQLANASSGPGSTSYLPYMNVATQASNDGRDVGLVTRVDPVLPPQHSVVLIEYPLPNSQCGWNGTGTLTSRRHYLSKFQLGSLGVAVIGVQFVDQPTDPQACAQREAEAEVVRRMVVEAMASGFEVVVLGEMNDYSTMDPDSLGSKPISAVLTLLQDVNKDGVDDLVNAASLVSRSARSTVNAPSNGALPGQQVDYILLSRGLMDLMEWVTINKSQTLASVSSHWPVVIKLSVPAGSPSSSLSPATGMSSTPTPSPAALGLGAANGDSGSGSINWLIVGITVAAIVSLACCGLSALVIAARFRAQRKGRREVAAAEAAAAQEEAGMAATTTAGTWEPITRPDPRFITSWVPIDRSLPTIRSGEQLDMKLYANATV